MTAISSRDTSSDKSISESEVRGSGGGRGNGSGQRGGRRLGRGTRGMRGRGKLCEIVSQPQSEPSTCATSSKDTSSDENDSESDVVCPVCKFPESNDMENTDWVQCETATKKTPFELHSSQLQDYVGFASQPRKGILRCVIYKINDCAQTQVMYVLMRFCGKSKQTSIISRCKQNFCINF